MRIKNTIFWLLFLPGFLFLSTLNAQSEREYDAKLLFNISYGYQFPAGDIADRFGTNSNVGIQVELLNEQNWIFGVEGYYMFGTDVKENVLQNIINADTIIYGEQGEPALLSLKERGFYLGLHAGKLITFPTAKGRSGIRATLGGGLLQHKIRIQEDPQAFVAQIDGDLKKGYDRLTNGFALNQTLGYQYLSRNQRINFYIAFEATQGFTQNRRDWNIDTMTADTESKLDLLFGIRLNWILPFYDLGEGTSVQY